MNRIFDFDGPVYKWGTEITDVMILSILWLVCSIPIVTIGASTTALYYILGKKVREEHTYVFKPFFKSFKDNFIQGTVLTFIVGFSLFSSYLYYGILISGVAGTGIKIIGLLFIMQVILISLYIFPVLSRFHMPIKNILVTSFVLANKHIISSLICLLFFIGCIMTVLAMTPFSILAFGVYALITSFILQRVFTKHIEHINEEDKEDEENQQLDDVQ